MKENFSAKYGSTAVNCSQISGVWIPALVSFINGVTFGKLLSLSAPHEKEHGDNSAEP